MKSTGFQVTTPAANEPITPEMMRLQSRVTAPDENALIAAYIASARDECERFTERQMLTSTLKAYYSCWPESDDFLELRRPPVQIVTSVKYYDTSNVQQTLSLSNVLVDIITEPARIYLAPTAAWPALIDRRNAIVVEYVAGWTTPELVPPLLRQGIRWRASELFENRSPSQIGRTVQDLTNAVRSCWSKYRIGSA